MPRWNQLLAAVQPTERLHHAIAVTERVLTSSDKCLAESVNSVVTKAISMLENTVTPRD